MVAARPSRRKDQAHTREERAGGRRSSRSPYPRRRRAHRTATAPAKSAPRPLGGPPVVRHAQPPPFPLRGEWASESESVSESVSVSASESESASAPASAPSGPAPS